MSSGDATQDLLRKWLLAGGGGGGGGTPLIDGTDTSVDLTTTPGSAMIQLNDILHIRGVRFGGTYTDTASGAIQATCRLATTGALPACTYDNGSAGIGATLTATANGALADQDGVTPVAGDLILVKDQASAFQNGPYFLLQLGDAGTPFILLRPTWADEAADFLHGIWLTIQEGNAYRGANLRCRARTYVLGTTSIPFGGTRRPSLSPSDVMFGADRTRDLVASDFTGFDADITTTTQYIPGSVFQEFLSGTAAKIAQVGTGEALRGVASLDVGTTTTGVAAVTPGGPGFVMVPTTAYSFFCKAKIPTASDGTDTFVPRLGWQTTINTNAAKTAGIYFEGTSGGNWQAVVMKASTSVPVDTGIAVSFAGYRNFVILYDEVTAFAYFYIGATLVASINTNFPDAGTVRAGASIIKSAGTTARQLYVDIMAINQTDARSVQQYAP